MLGAEKLVAGTVIASGTMLLGSYVVQKLTASEDEGKRLLGGIEAGGTTFGVSIAKGSPENVIERYSIPTTTPEETLKNVYNIFKGKKIAALGIAAFGPIDLNRQSKTYGFITSTPKRGWRDVDLVGFFKKRMNVPIEFTTDVNAVALSELKYGNHGRVSSCCYVTVGTGVGVGVAVHGKAVSGLMHPEGGHIKVRRHPDDTYEGNCPFHKDCVEGLANAGAVAARCGVQPSELKNIPDSHPVWDIEAFYLGQLCVAMVCLISPEVIVLGGGVLRRLCLFNKIRQVCLEQLNGYIGSQKLLGKSDEYIARSVFDKKQSNLVTAGAVGSTLLALLALERGLLLSKGRKAGKLRAKL